MQDHSIITTTAALHCNLKLHTEYGEYGEYGGTTMEYDKYKHKHNQSNLPQGGITVVRVT